MESTQRVCKIILISHGELAKAMLDSVRLLMGDHKYLAAYCLAPGQRVEELEQLLRKDVQLFGAENLLVLSDVQYGSPFNAAVAVAMEQPRLHHITGMNLAVVLSAISVRNACFPEMDLDEICNKIIAETSASIVDVRRLLAESLQEEIEEE